MKTQFILLFSLCLSLVYAQDKSGAVYQGGTYVHSVYDSGKGEFGPRDTVKADYSFVLYLTSKFIYIKDIPSLDFGNVTFEDVKFSDMRTSSLKELGFNQNQSVFVSFPYSSSADRKVIGTTINYSLLDEIIIVKV